MKRLLLLAAFLALSHGLFGQEIFYKSNDFGMALLPIEKYHRDESRWIMGIQSKGDGEVRRLYDKGKEVHRWEVSWTQKPRQKVERELAAGVLTARRVWDATGNLLQEEQYGEGKLTQKTLFTYSGTRLMRKRALAADGSLQYTEEYLYSLRGALREVRRTGEQDKGRGSAFVFGPSGVSEERDTTGQVQFVTRYDTDGRVTNQERREAGKTVSREDFVYRPDSRLLVSSSERLPADGKLIRRAHDEKGRVVTETTLAGDSVVEETRYARNDAGNVTAKTRKSSRGQEAWKYSLDADGKVAREEYFIRGSLEKVTIHGEGKQRAEELYKNGEMFLKVYYDGDTKLREEVYAGGVLLRERKYP
jgi:antitoxin component YwqK of YwqJK toxin-antitoxin module